MADKLNHLFAMVHPPGADREYTGKEVVAAVNSAGTDLSASHLSELRRGIKANPTIRVLEALAQFFGVRVAYLLDDPRAVEEVEAELLLRRAMQDAEVRDVAMRAAGLDAQHRAAMYRLLAQIVDEHADGPPPPAAGW